MDWMRSINAFVSPTNQEPFQNIALPMLFLERLLELDRLDENVYQSQELYKPTESQFVYGGCIVAQALNAIFRSFTDADPNSTVICDSLHCYFLLPSVTHLPIVYSVQFVRDGRVLKNRRVEGRQSEQIIFIMEANFLVNVTFESQTEQSVFQSGDPMRLHQLGSPEELPTLKSLYAAQLAALSSLSGAAYQERRAWLTHRIEQVSPTEERPCFPSHLQPIKTSSTKAFTHYRADRDWFWWRPAGSESELASLKMKPASLYQCMMAFASDHILFIALRPFDYHYGHPDILSMKSLDHTIHFHTWLPLSSLSLDSLWTLFEPRVERIQNGRAYTSGRMYSRSGLCLATITQEGLLKLKQRIEILNDQASKL